MKIKKFVLGIFAVLIALLIFAQMAYASSVKISKERVKQGGFFEITISGLHPEDVFTITFQKRKYQFAPDFLTTSYRAVIPVSVFDEVGYAEILLESKYTTVIPKKIFIEKADYEESEKVEVVRPLSSKNLKQYEKEQAVLAKIYGRTTKYPFFVAVEGPTFVHPLGETIEISSPFGFLRKRKVGAKSEKVESVVHGGIDLVVPNGRAVLASETGIVRLAQNLVNSGNTIIIDHGYNIFSVYLHLSKIFVSEGEVVWAYDKIALSGDTGRVTGPHLHFGIRIWDTWVDPKYFVKSLGGEK